jgi:hypothetical protein
VTDGTRRLKSAPPGAEPRNADAIVLGYLVAKSCAVMRCVGMSAWVNAREVSIYTGVGTRDASRLLQKLARMRDDIAHEPARARDDGRAVWRIVGRHDGLAFLDAHRPPSPLLPGPLTGCRWVLPDAERED